MGRWDPYSRRELRRRRRAWGRRNARVLALFSAMVLGVAIVVTWVLASTSPNSFTWYALGVMHVGLVGGSLHAVNALFLASDRDAIHHVRGAWGEENTRDELRRARRRRLVWGWVDSIGLQVGDIDHLVVTRRGGLVAIDSKWRSEITRTDTLTMAQSAQRARRRAEGVARTRLSKQRGSHRARGSSLNVTPVVVIWGAAQASVPDDAVVDGVRFLAGRHLLAWLRGCDGEPVSKHAAAEALTQLERFRASAWPDA